MPLSPYLHTVDLCVLFYCRAAGELKLLLNKREAEPFAGHWALPGVVVNGDVQDLSLQAAVERLRASDKVGLSLAWSEQVGTVGDAFRDPRCWSSSTYYLAIVSDETQLGEHQGWFSLKAVADGSIKLPFDHNSIVAAVQERLFSKSLYSSLPLMFLGNEFSAPLQKVPGGLSAGPFIGLHAHLVVEHVERQHQGQPQRQDQQPGKQHQGGQ
jgi:ADP-ribose pyrophosphatase YjhB (NUDIX family)